MTWKFMRGFVHQHNLSNLCSSFLIFNCSSVRSERQKVYYSRKLFMADNVINDTISFNVKNDFYASISKNSKLSPNVETKKMCWYTYCDNQHLFDVAKNDVKHTSDCNKFRIFKRLNSISRARIFFLWIHWARAYFGSTVSKGVSNLYLGTHGHAEAVGSQELDAVKAYLPEEIHRRSSISFQYLQRSVLRTRIIYQTKNAWHHKNHSIHQPGSFRQSWRAEMALCI